jgi:hypothetical protein
LREKEELTRVLLEVLLALNQRSRNGARKDNSLQITHHRQKAKENKECPRQNHYNPGQPDRWPPPGRHRHKPKRLFHRKAVKDNDYQSQQG